MLPRKVTGQRTNVLREVTAMILALLKLSHDAVTFQELLGPETLVCDLLSHLVCQDLPALLRVQDLSGQHRETLMQERNVKILHLSRREPTIHRRHIFLNYLLISIVSTIS